jgi:putative tryptophan/tyrosine transport system substrate-binding protein
MRRREFITLVGGGAAAWPLAASAQQAERVRRIGALMSFSATDPQGPPRAKAFQQSLQDLGWVEGRNVRFDYRWTGSNPDKIRTFADELVRLNPDVLLANGPSLLAGLQQATRTLPIVFVIVDDPVGAGFVSTIANPGGNTTGFSSFESSLGGKWLGLLKEVGPHITHVGILFNPITAPYVQIYFVRLKPLRRRLA